MKEEDRKLNNQKYYREYYRDHPELKEKQKIQRRKPERKEKKRIYDKKYVRKCKFTSYDFNHFLGGVAIMSVMATFAAYLDANWWSHLGGALLAIIFYILEVRDRRRQK